MERKPILVGLTDGRITNLSIDTSREERIAFIKSGCDSVILRSGNMEVPSFDAVYKIELVEVA